MEDLLKEHLEKMERALDKQADTLRALQSSVESHVNVFERHARLTEAVDKRLLMVMSALLFLGSVQLATLLLHAWQYYHHS